MPFHPGFLGSAPLKVVHSLTANAVDNANQNTYTFTSQAIGTQSNDRFIAVCVELTGGITTATLDSVTVGGVSATRRVAGSASGGFKEIWTTPTVANSGPTGTTANIVVSATSSPVCLNCAIEVYAITGASSVVPTATASDTAAPLSQSINVPANGLCIGGARGVGTPGNATWTGLTKDADNAVDAGVSHSTSASAEFTTAQVGLTVACSFAAGTATGMAVAAWGP